MQAVLTKIILAGVTRITWTGGEPTICNELPLLLERGRKSKIVNVLTTHGLSLASKIVDQLDSARDSIRFSFDGLEITHNRIRGGSFFQKTLQELKRISNAGFRTEVNISVMSSNVREIPELMRVIRHSGATKMVLMTLMMRESALDNKITAAIQPDLYNLYQEASKFQIQNSDVKVVINDYNSESDAYVVIESDGDILLCSEIEADKSIGNILSGDGDHILKIALEHQTLDHRQSPA